LTWHQSELCMFPVIQLHWPATWTTWKHAALWLWKRSLWTCFRGRATWRRLYYCNVLRD